MCRYSDYIRTESGLQYQVHVPDIDIICYKLSSTKHNNLVVLRVCAWVYDARLTALLAFDRPSFIKDCTIKEPKTSKEHDI